MNLRMHFQHAYIQWTSWNYTSQSLSLHRVSLQSVTNCFKTSLDIQSHLQWFGIWTPPKHTYYKNNQISGGIGWMPRGHPSQGTNTIWRCLPILNLKQSVKPGLAVFWMDLLHPWNLTWNLKRSPWKRRFLLETIIFRFHVKFRGSICFFSRW